MKLSYGSSVLSEARKKRGMASRVSFYPMAHRRKVFIVEDRMIITFTHDTVPYSKYIVADRMPIYLRQSVIFGYYHYNLRAKQWLCDLAERFVQRYVQDAINSRPLDPTWT